MPRLAIGVGSLAMSVAMVAGVVVAAPGARAAAPGPNPPTATDVYAGVGGAVVTWQIPRGGPAPTGYEIQRADSATGPFNAVASVGAQDRRWQDPTALAAQSYTYRVVAAADGVRSASGPRRTTRIPAFGPGGPLVKFDIAGPPGSPWANGLVFTDAQVTVTRLDDRSYSVRGVSDASSPQGAQDVAFTIGSTVRGSRTGFGDYPTVGPGALQSRLPFLYPTTPGLCGPDRSGTLDQRGASFSADGTPLVLAAAFDYCGAVGHVLWHSDQAFNVLVPAVSRVEAAPEQKVSVEFRNIGGTTISPAAAKIEGFANGTPVPAGWSIVDDGCTGIAVNSGNSCVVTVSRTAASASQARLILRGYGQFIEPEVVLASGPDVPAPPRRSYTGASTHDGAVVEWVPRAADPAITAYSIYRERFDGTQEKVAEVGPEAHGRWVDRDPRAQLGARYWVTALNTAGESARSEGYYASYVEGSGTVAATTMWNSGTDRDLAIIENEGPPLRLSLDAGDHAEPAVGPGSRIVYAADTDGADAGDYDLWTRPFRGGTAQRLTQNPASSDRRPAVSPDGRTVAFTRFVGGLPSIWTVPFDGGAARVIPGTEGDSDPAWAPSGQVLAVSRATATGSRIDVVSLGGGYRRTLASTEVEGMRAVRPTWTGRNPTVSYVRLGDIDRTVPVDALTGEQNANSTPIESDNGVADFDGPVKVGGYGTSYSWSKSVGPPTATGAGIDATSAALTWTQAKILTDPACRECARWTIVRRSAPNGAAPDTPDAGVPVYEGPGTAARATGLETGANFRFSLFALNAIGETSRAATSGAVPAAPPVVTPNGSALTALDGDGPSFTLRWGPALPSGSGYEIQVDTQAFDTAKAAYSTTTDFQPFSAGPATSKVYKATPGTTYFARGRIVDQYGGTTAWGPVAKIVVPYDDRGLTASKGWTALSKQKGRYAGTLRQSSTVGAALTSTVYASTVGLIGEVCPTCGKVGVYVDGKLKATVDTYAKTAAARRTVWSMSFSSVGKHSLKFVVVKNAKRPTVRIDGLTAGH